MKKHTHHPEFDPLLPGIFAVFVIVMFVFFSRVAFHAETPTVQKLKHPFPSVTPLRNRLDFNQPILCNFVTEKSSVSAYMVGNDIAVAEVSKPVTKRYVVTGGCAYTWMEGQMSGSKRCGIGPAILMGKQLIQSNIVQPESIAESLGKGMSGVQIQNCKNGKNPGKEVFSIPTGIRFVENEK